MENLLDNLKNLLQKDERLVSEGELLKNKIIELAIKLDKDLIELLLADKQMKEVFFTQAGKATIFDKDKFIKFVSNKQFLPDSYTAFKNKIGLTEDDEFISEKKEVVLSWPYKDCILEGGMTKEDQKRDEIFWNEILAPDEISRLLDPKVFTGAKRIDKNGPAFAKATAGKEHKFDGFKTDENGDIKDNLIIKGNNLLALHSLKKRFAGKVKLIYIDPPYNTGNDEFKYNDAFNHSSWLVFMKNRLEVARELLGDDGVIFVQCDDNEQAYLKVLMDDIFERENFINTVSLRVSPPEGIKTTHASKTILKEKEYLHVYTKNKQKLSIKPIYIKADAWDTHYGSYIENIEEPIQKWKAMPLSQALKKEKLDADLNKKDFNRWIIKNAKRIFQLIDAGKYKNIEKYKKDKFQWTEDKKIIIYRGRKVHFLTEGLKQTDIGLTLSRLLCDFWKDISFNNLFQEGGVSLLRGKKPEKLIKRLIEMITDPGEVILDFFMGTGTTCAVAHKMGRQYIGVEQLDYGKNSAVVRLKNVINGDQTGISKSVGWKGGGDFVYLELMKWNENFVEKIKKTKTKQELEKLWETMKEKAFLSYKVDIKAVDENARDFEDLSIENQKRFLLECLDKNHLYVNYSEIDDEEYGVSVEDRRLNREFYKN